MNFSEALIHLKNGRIVRRSKWNADLHLKGGKIHILHHGVIYSLHPWQADHESLLANDWEVTQ